MKLKTNAQGQPIVDDGLPVWIDEDGAEHAYNVPELVHDLHRLADQQSDLRKQLDQQQEHLQAYQGIDPAEARQALQRLDDLHHERLIDAGEAEQVRRHLEEQYTAKLQQSHDTLQQRDEQIRHLVLRHAFDASPFLREQTLLVPDMAYSYFGKHFTVEERDGQLTPVARLDGKPLMSPSRPGQLASPEEALRLIVQQHPDSDRMLKAGYQGGPGGSGSRHQSPPPASWSRLSTEAQAAYIDQHGIAAAKALIDAEA